MKKVIVDNVILGEGLPKIIIPLVGKTNEQLLEEARLIQSLECDIVEWRIDFYEHVLTPKVVADFSKELKKVLQKPLLITFRSKKEGGELEISDTEYTQLYQALITDAQFDLLDVELFMPENDVNSIVTAAHKKRIKIVMCNHDFDATPSKEEIISRLKAMQEKNADICKIAVMPNSPNDVLTLLAATEEMTRLYADRPIITMSMGELGMISRVSGQLFGSCATFGTAKQASAPGQLPAGDLRKILQSLQITS